MVHNASLYLPLQNAAYCTVVIAGILSALIQFY